jgi:quercetin dioxygenase-like cupin family protein
MSLKEKLLHITQTSEKVNHQLTRVKDLLDLGVLKYASMGVLDNQESSSKTEIIYDEGVSIGVTVGDKEGAVYPRHRHVNSVQYLICVEGKFAIEIFETKKIIRIIEMGECVSVPPDIEHEIITLVEKSKLVSVCVPQEPSYVRKIMEVFHAK